jgi:hypothetical protein
MFRFLRPLRALFRLSREVEEAKMLAARQIVRANQRDAEWVLENLQRAEFKVFSQWGDDGIIQFLVNYLEIEPRTFVEFGVENYREANTRFLLLNNNWRGLVLDGSEKNVRQIRQDRIYWQHDLSAQAAFVTAENINNLLKTNGFEGPIGLLHIDIDGNDYWVWKAIEAISPVLVIVEYNSVFGAEQAWTTPYDPTFFRTRYHASNLCYGASLSALCDLAAAKGYAFVGSNSHGNNAYFVRNDCLRDLRALSAQEGYVESRFREGRDARGQLTHLGGAARLEALRGLQVFDTRANQLTII